MLKVEKKIHYLNIKLIKIKMLGKAILYTTIAPILADNESSVELKSHGYVTVDEREQLRRLIIAFPKVNRSGEVGKVMITSDLKLAHFYTIFIVLMS